MRRSARGFVVCRVPIGFAKDFCKSAAMSSNPQRFAEVVLKAFRDRKLFRDEDVKAARGPSSTWMTGLRKVAKGDLETFEASPRGDIFDRIDTAAGWPGGTARDFWMFDIAPPVSLAVTSTGSRDLDTSERLRHLEQRVAELEVQVDRMRGVRS